jgi:hypothetical protein
VNPHIRALADILVEICVRELKNAPAVEQTQVPGREDEQNESIQTKSGPQGCRDTRPFATERKTNAQQERNSSLDAVR